MNEHSIQQYKTRRLIELTQMHVMDISARSKTYNFDLPQGIPTNHALAIMLPFGIVLTLFVI